MADLDEQQRTTEEEGLTELLQLVVTNCPTPLAILDGQLRYLYASDSWIRLYHVEGQSVIGEGYYDVLPDLPQSWREVHRRVLQTGETQQGEDLLFRADGREDWIRWEVRRWMKPDGDIGGLMLFDHPVNQHRGDEALRVAQESERIFHTRLGDMHRLTLQMARCENLDELCRLAVNRARTCLGVDRLSVWLKDGETEVHGTYGVTEEGQIRDERTSRIVLNPGSPIYRSAVQGEPIIVQDNLPLRNNRAEIVGYGSQMVACLVDGQKIVGCICADNLLSGKPFGPRERELTTVFASTVGNLINRLNLERERQESEDRLRMILTAGGATGWRLDLDTNMLDCSEGAMRLFGKTQIGVDEFNERIHPEDRQKSLSPDALKRIDGDLPVAEYRVVTPSGQIVWLNRQGRVERNAVGQAVTVSGVWIDITERRRAELTAIQSLQRLTMALEASDLGTWYVDLPEETRAWSRQTKEHWGIAPDVQVTREMFEAGIHPEDRRRVLEAHSKSREDGLPYDVTHRTVGPDGRIRWIRSMGMPFADEAGRVIRFDGLTVDLTERIEAERELEHRVAQRTAELLAANEEMEGFTYSISHDLRAPLRAIMASSTILLREHSSQLDSYAKDQLEKQAAAAKRLADLIDDLLRLTRIGRQEMRRKPIDLTSLVRKIACEISKEVEPKPVVEVQEGMTIEADEQLMGLAIQNLLENAFKFAQPGPARVQVGVRDGVYFVRDEGIGFEQQYALRIFQPFERLHRSSEYPGTGIGLANVKRIIDRHGGNVWAEGESGKGATFWFAV